MAKARTYRGGGSRAQIPDKFSIMARDELLRKGINPVDMMVEVYNQAMKSYREGHGDTEKGHAGTAYLATAGQMAKGLMDFYSPKMSAVAVEIHDASKSSEAPRAVNPMQIILSDPFAKHALKIAEAAQANLSTHDIKPEAPPILAGGKRLAD